jgi:hypothetical protein
MVENQPLRLEIKHSTLQLTLISKVSLALAHY